MKITYEEKSHTILNRVSDLDKPSVHWDTVVVGGGPAGMLAAAAAGGSGRRVALLDKNNGLGRKMLITGGGRCNLTNTASLEQFLAHVPERGKFLMSALSVFSSEQCRQFFRKLGVKTKVEEEGKVFPESDRAAEAVEALHDHLIQLGVRIFNPVAVSDLMMDNGSCLGVRTEKGQDFYSRSVILATGGISYPGTGSTGDGYRLARQAGHHIESPLPGLVPLCFKDRMVGKSLQGISVKGAVLTLFAGNKKQVIQEGDIVFTHFGISGPAALKISRWVSRLVFQGISDLQIVVDTLPQMGEQELLEKFLFLSEQQPKKSILSILKQVVPERLALLTLGMVGLDVKKKSGENGKGNWRTIALLLKKFSFELSGTRSLKEAMVTVGGVCIREVNPGTMSSRLARGLYFAGELLDVDAYTGGFNMQIAFATGWLAGTSASREADSNGNNQSP